MKKISKDDVIAVIVIVAACVEIVYFALKWGWL